MKPFVIALLLIATVYAVRSCEHDLSYGGNPVDATSILFLSWMCPPLLIPVALVATLVLAIIIVAFTPR